MLFHLIYVSSAVVPMSELGLARMLKGCRVRNEQNRITGMLLYKNSHFMQVLEGPEANVAKVFGDIEKDARHKSVDVLRSEYIQSRDFPNWTMGFADVDQLDLSKLPGFTRFLELEFTSEYFVRESVEAHRMLLAFKESP